jgi:hypothetical protein
VGDAHAAKVRIATLQHDDGGDQFRPDQRAKLRQPVRAHEQRREAENEAIDEREIGRLLSGAVADEQLVLQQQRLGGDGADATGARKTARSVRVASHYQFAIHSSSGRPI